MTLDTITEVILAHESQHQRPEPYLPESKCAVMISLHFKGAMPEQRCVIGPSESFRVAGNFIRNAVSGDILARFHNHYWDVGGQHYSGYECTQPVAIHFEDAEGGRSDVYGPYKGISVADGSAYAGNKLIAKFVDQTLLWHDHQSDTFWPNFYLEGATLATDR